MQVRSRRARTSALPVFVTSVVAGVLAASVPAIAESPVTVPEASAAANTYQIVYGAALDPVAHRADVRIAVRQSRSLLRHIEFVAPRDRYLDVHGQGAIETTADHIEWTPPADGGVLHFEFAIDHVRDNGARDARITESWALLKLDHLFPKARVRVVKGARSRATLRLTAPAGWSIETPYGPAAGHLLKVDDPSTRFDRPKGWMVAGKLALRRDVIADRRVAVASPEGSGFRSNDVLAFVRWTLPSLVQVFPEFPPRLLIVSGPDSMWRGGLSGAGSMYLHADRPLISQNGTSTPLHEMIHVANGLHGTGGADWIVEGIAEYYSLEVLRRSNSISQERFDSALTTLAQWSTGTKCIATDRSEGAQTAHAVLVMRALDREIRAATHDQKSLDDLVRTLTDAHAPVTNAAFRSAAVVLIGGPTTALAECP
jgi:hypothetical protein